jgi:HEAT repeat protein
MNTDSFHEKIADILCQLDGTSIDFEDFADAAGRGIGWDLALLATTAKADDLDLADDIVEMLTQLILDAESTSDEKLVSEAFRALFFIGPLATHSVMPVLRHCLLHGNGHLRYWAAEILWRITRNAEILLPVVEELLGDKDWRVRTGAAELLKKVDD